MQFLEKPHLFVYPALMFGLFVLWSAAPAFCQTAENNNSLILGRRQEPPPKSVRDMLAKQRTERQKKDHEELLKRSEEAALLSLQLEITFSATSQLSPADFSKLESLEKLVSRIRKSLGGDDDDRESEGPDEWASDRRPSDLKEAFSDLKDVSGKLVEELKKTSRFTVSVVAIQSSNTVLKLVRFLRLRR